MVDLAHENIMLRVCTSWHVRFREHAALEVRHLGGEVDVRVRARSRAARGI